MEIGGLLAQLVENGLGDFEGGEAVRELARKQDREDEKRRLAETQIVRDALDNEAGLRFVMWLAGKTMFRGENEAEIGATTCETYALAKAKRQGQNAVFLMIVDALQQGRAPAPAKPRRKVKGSGQ